MKSHVTPFGIALSLALPHAARAQVVTPPPVPISIDVRAPEQAFLRGHGFGTQNRECQPVTSLRRVGWVLFTPRAALLGELNEQFSTHFFSPDRQEAFTVRGMWQASRDTGTVWGEVIASSVDAHVVKAGAPQADGSEQKMVTEGSEVVVAPEASVESASFMQNVDFASFAVRAVKGETPALRLPIPLDRSSQASRSNQPGAHARSTKRIIAGAIAGGLGGFFGGGFLGAHIEGDRCNCDDPGVRGFLIGAPIGAAAGSILGAKFLF